MSPFEFIFALFGLLLGLSIVEVLGGLARAIEARLRPDAVLRIGWLTPLLGIFVLLDLLSFWQAAWATRDAVSVSGHSLMAVTAFASAYYLAAHLVFPREPAKHEELDSHYFRVRRIVLAVMLPTAVLIALSVTTLMPPPASSSAHLSTSAGASLASVSSAE